MKKRFFAAVLAAVLAGIPQTVISAAEIMDAKCLQSALLSKEKMSMEDDFDKNGVVNAIDLTLMKRSLLASDDDNENAEIKTVSYTADANNVKLIGRTLAKNGVTWLVQSGSAVEFTVTGTEASVTIAGDGNVYSEEKWRPRYGVFLDGKLLTDVVMDEKEQTVKLFSASQSRTVTVKIIHLSEANNGAVGVKSIEVTSDKKTPIKPTEKKSLSIEYIGDSITCAYGVEAPSQYESFSTGTENFTKSYAYLTSQILDADYSAVSYSGYGIISGYSSDGKANIDSLVPNCYTLVGKPTDYAVEWDFVSHQNDVVVINLGTNDDSYCSKDLQSRAADFQKEYEAFLKTVREYNPESYIICTLGIMGCEELYPYIEKAVANVGDTKISCFQSPTQNSANGLGADWHPSELTHQQNAYLLADKICETIGRESSKIGLNMAADGEYGAYLNKENGVNASTYLNDWDKSFWVSVVTGGNLVKDVTMYVRNMTLVSGDYDLSFRTTPPSNMTLIYQVRSMDDPAVIYCEGDLVGDGKEQKINASFHMAEKADNCEIVVLMGATDSVTMTFNDVSLIKKG